MIDLTLDAPPLQEAAAPPKPDQDFPSTLLDIFDSTVAAWGEHIALDVPDGVLSYEELARSAQAVADRLCGGGVGPGDRVGVRVPSGTADLYVAILGVLRSGAAYVPVDADDPATRAEQLLSDAGVCALLGPELELSWRAPAGGRVRQPSPDDDAWIIFTSGSTGAPKGVAVTHRSAAALVDAESTLWGVIPEDRVLAGLSVAFDASCEEMWLAWGHGAALVPAPRHLVRSGAGLGPWLAERAVTVISTVPTLAAIWDEKSLSAVRLLILGGEACPDQLAWRLAEGREVWNTYGPTEATVVTTAARIRRGAPVTIGIPLPGWEVAVVDADGEPVPAGDPGELVIGGVAWAGTWMPSSTGSATGACLQGRGSGPTGPATWCVRPAMDLCSSVAETTRSRSEAAGSSWARSMRSSAPCRGCARRARSSARPPPATGCWSATSPQTPSPSWFEPHSPSGFRPAWCP